MGTAILRMEYVHVKRGGQMKTVILQLVKMSATVEESACNLTNVCATRDFPGHFVKILSVYLAITGYVINQLVNAFVRLVFKATIVHI